MRPRISVLALLVALVAAACSSGSSSSKATPSGATTGPPGPTSSTVAPYRLDDTLRMDQIQVLSSHNSYHGRPYPQVLAALYKSTPALARTLDYAHAPLPQQFDIGVRQIELDVWSDPKGGKYAKPSFPIAQGVKIPNNPVMLQPGLKVIHQADIDTNSTCLTFVLCIKLVKSWSDAHPSHVPIDIHVEMKDDAPSTQLFVELEKEILSVFGRREIITPDDVRGDAATLGAAVRAHGWPTLGTVRGKVYFTLDNEGAYRTAYLVGHPSLRGRLAFTPSAPGQDDAAFAKLNDPVADAAKIKAALAAHMIVRTRADADTGEARANDHTHERAALSGGAQVVSTDYEKPDPKLGNGYTTKIPGGTPARCDPVTAPPGCTPTDVEDPTRLTIKVP
jgi:Phosphoinositide phospholipase C, Ca2+-dependent